MEILEVSKIIFFEIMVIVSAITNVFFSLIVIIIAVVELFFIWIGILDIVGIFLMGILNIIYACMRLRKRGWAPYDPRPQQVAVGPQGSGGM